MKIRSLSSRAARSGRRSGGFSLVELMVGVGIGLLCTLVIATVLGATEGRRRGTMQGSDMQVSGSLALYNLQREIATAGYGFANDGAEVGCQLQAKYNGAAVTALPSVLAPVFVTEGANGASDQVRVLASSKFVNSNPAALSTVGYTAPSRIILPYYAPNDTVYNVASSLSISKGDLLVAIAKDTTQACGLFQVTGDPTPTTVPRANDPTHWNAVGHPSQTSAEWSFLVNLGNIIDVNFTADADGKLTADVTGDLTFHGVTKPILVKATFLGEGKDPWGGYRAGFEGTTNISRKEFNKDGMDVGPQSDNVQLYITFEGVKAK